MLDSLYENIGGKIKSWAKWIFIVEAIGSIIAGIVLAAEEDILYIFIAIIGPFIAWVSSWILYAFGELVEDVGRIRKHFIPDATVTQNKETDIPQKPACDFCRKSNNKLKTYKSNSTLGSGESKFNLCEKCAKDNGFI